MLPRWSAWICPHLRVSRGLWLMWCLWNTLTLPIAPALATDGQNIRAGCCCSAQAKSAGTCCCIRSGDSCCSKAAPKVPTCCSQRTAKPITTQRSTDHRPVWRACGCGHARTELGLLAAEQRLSGPPVCLFGDAEFLWTLREESVVLPLLSWAPVSPPPECAN
jgi:hypothetical protein